MLSYEVKAMAMLNLAINFNSEMIAMLTAVIAAKDKVSYKKVLKSIKYASDSYYKKIKEALKE